MRKESRRLQMKLQFFAEPKEPQEPENHPEELSLDDVMEKFSVDDILARPELAKGIQSRIDSTVTKALNTARTKWEQEQLDNMDEAKRLEKMSAEQREKYQFEKFEHEQLVVATGKELLKRGLDSSFASYLTGTNAEDTNAKIDSFEQLFNSAVTNATNKKMQGEPPKEPKTVKTITLDTIKTMSADEINKNWDEVQLVLAGKK